MCMGWRMTKPMGVTMMTLYVLYLVQHMLVEVNNGRLAMIGIFGFMAADAVPGSVPILDRFNIAIPYDGQIMAPLSSEFSFFGDVAVKAPEVARAVVDAVSDIA